MASIDFGLLSENQKYKSRKITDGVSSDIWHVKTSENEYALKEHTQTDCKGRLVCSY